MRILVPDYTVGEPGQRFTPVQNARHLPPHSLDQIAHEGVTHTVAVGEFFSTSDHYRQGYGYVLEVE